MENSIRSTKEAQQLGDFFNNILVWGEYIDLIKEGSPVPQINKIKEEVDEYEDAVFLGDKNHAAEEAVDILVTVIISAEQNGIRLVDHLDTVVKKLQSRQDTGKMVNGSFIKKEDLKCQ